MMEEQAGLIAACIAGDETAIEQLVQAYQLGVFRLALSVLGDPGEANEVAQDTFIAALGALRSYQQSSNFKAWLYKIALNFSRSRLRKRKALQRLQLALTALFHTQMQRAPSVEDAIIHDEEEQALWKALQTLDEKHRLAMVLFYYHDLSVKEIAEILNIKEGTVHSRLSIGRQKLRAELAGLHATTGEST